MGNRRNLKRVGVCSLLVLGLVLGLGSGATMFPTQAYAAEESSVDGANKKGYVGAQLGAGFLSNSTGANIPFGGTVGYRIIPKLIVGIVVNYMSLGMIANSSTTISGSGQNITYFGVEADYPLYTWLDGLHIGAKLGLASVLVAASVSGSVNGSINNTQAFFGPKLGYDFILPGTHVSLGGEAGILLKGTSPEPIVGFGTINGVSTIVNVLGVAKYWF